MEDDFKPKMKGMHDGTSIRERGWLPSLELRDAVSPCRVRTTGYLQFCARSMSVSSFSAFLHLGPLDLRSLCIHTHPFDNSLNMRNLVMCELNRGGLWLGAIPQQHFYDRASSQHCGSANCIGERDGEGTLVDFPSSSRCRLGFGNKINKILSSIHPRFD